MTEVPSHRRCPGGSHTAVSLSVAYGTLLDADRWSTLAMNSRS
jgi:hypothetical protein